LAVYNIYKNRKFLSQGMNAIFVFFIHPSRQLKTLQGFLLLLSKGISFFVKSKTKQK